MELSGITVSPHNTRESPFENMSSFCKHNNSISLLYIEERIEKSEVRIIYHDLLLLLRHCGELPAEPSFF